MVSKFPSFRSELKKRTTTGGNLQFSNGFSRKLLCHLTFNRNFRIFVLNGKYPRLTCDMNIRRESKHYHKHWHSPPKRPRSFWSAPRISTSGLVQHQKSAIHGLSIKSDKSDWLRIRSENSTHAQKIESAQRS